MSSGPACVRARAALPRALAVIACGAALAACRPSDATPADGGGLDALAAARLPRPFAARVAVEHTMGTTTTFGEQTAQSATVSDRITVKVTVPPRARYEFMVRVSYGKVSVPYTARISRVLPTGAPSYDDISGVYTNVSSTNYDIVAVDVTGGVARPVQTLPAPAGRAALPRP